MSPAPSVLAALAVIAVALLPTPASAHPPASGDAYRWVVAPDWSPQREPAEGRHARVDPSLLEAGAATVWTPDFQAVVSLASDSPVSTPATVIVTPLDPSSLPRLADGHPNGNAYHVRVQTTGWEPSVVQVSLATPFEAVGLVALREESWQALPMERGAMHATAPVSLDVVVLAVASRVDGHDGWWDAFLHDPRRVTLLVAAVLAVVGRWWMIRRDRVGSSVRVASGVRSPGRQQQYPEPG